jgi:hypothetical protein
MNNRFLNKMGHRFLYSPYKVERGKIKEFALAIGVIIRFIMIGKKQSNAVTGTCPSHQPF